MRKLMIACSTVVMMTAMGTTAFAANTVSAPSAGPGSYSYCAYYDDDGDGICDSCANERAHCGHDGHVGACSYGDGRDGRYRENCSRDDCYREDCDGIHSDDCGGTHRDGCGHGNSARTGSGRRGHHGGCR